MFFRQVLHRDLGCASYVVADGGEAAVIDPKWEIEDYLALAEQEGFRITRVLETHNHADHVSGRGRLVEATGATVYAPKEAGVAYEHLPLADGDAVEVGRVRIIALATPDHRPEHTAYLLEDPSRGEAPWLLLSGDSLFVGDVARPDLAVDAKEGAHGLYETIRRLLELDDYVEVWPGHVGGSLCGGARMSEKPSSTIGYERRFNTLLALESEDEFSKELTRDLAPQPPNFKRIVALNSGPPITEAAQLEPLAPARVEELLRRDATLLDGREPREYNNSHVPGSLSVPMVRAAVGTRAAWVVDPESAVIVTAASDDEARSMARMLEAIGFRGLRGYLEGGVPAWQGAGRQVEAMPSIDVSTLADRLADGDVDLLDVREDDEWTAGHVAGSLHVPYHELREGVPVALPRRADRPLAVACSAGNRSSLAVSLLRRRDVDDLVLVAEGGIADLERHGIELVKGAS